MVDPSTASQRPSFAYQVDAAIESTSLISAESLAVPPSAPEDSNSWLEVSPDELDGMLQRASGRNGLSTDKADKSGPEREVQLGEEHGQALHDLAQQVEQFVGGQGDVQGARFAECVYVQNHRNRLGADTSVANYPTTT